MNVPVVIVFFNRLEPLPELVARLKEIKPSKVYLVADGARTGRAGEPERVAACRAFMESVAWQSEVRTNFSQTNLGCSDRIYTGLNWVFEQEECAIIIEDDCLPVNAFFEYAEMALEKYKDEERVMSVCGSNPAAGAVSMDEAFCFSRYPMVWGWATWRRAWRKMDYGLSGARGWRRFRMLHHWLGSFRAALYWSYILARPAPSWDYRWAFTSFLNHGLNLLPSARLVDNVGMTPDSTHTAYNPYELPVVDDKWRCSSQLPKPCISEDVDRWIEDHVFSRSFAERLKWVENKIKRRIAG